MVARLPTIAGSLAFMLLSACRQPEFQIPSPANFPHNWLLNSVPVSVLEKDREFHARPGSKNKDRWDNFQSKLQPGDELWKWEDTDHSKFYPFGFCIIRNGKIVAVLWVSVQAWID